MSNAERRLRQAARQHCGRTAQAISAPVFAQERSAGNQHHPLLMRPGLFFPRVEISPDFREALAEAVASWARLAVRDSAAFARHRASRARLVSQADVRLVARRNARLQAMLAERSGGGPKAANTGSGNAAAHGGGNNPKAAAPALPGGSRGGNGRVASDAGGGGGGALGLGAGGEGTAGTGGKHKRKTAGSSSAAGVGREPDLKRARGERSSKSHSKVGKKSKKTSRKAGRKAAALPPKGESLDDEALLSLEPVAPARGGPEEAFDVSEGDFDIEEDLRRANDDDDDEEPRDLRRRDDDDDDDQPLLFSMVA